MERHIEILAEERAQRGTREGRDPRPWEDPHRLFIEVDVPEELADAYNYNQWAQEQTGRQWCETARTWLSIQERYIKLAYECGGLALAAQGNSRRAEKNETL